MKLLALALAATLPAAAIAAPAQAQFIAPDMAVDMQVGYVPGYGPGYDPGYGPGYDPGYAPGYGTNMSVGHVIDMVLGQLGGYTPVTYPMGSPAQLEQYKCNTLHQRGQYADFNSNARFTVGRSYGSHVVKTWHDGMRCRAAAVGQLGQWVSHQGSWATVSTRFDLRNGSLVENRNGHVRAYPSIYSTF